MVVVTVLVVASFVGSTLFVEQRSRRVDREAEHIVAQTTPNVRELVSARSELRRIASGVGRQLGARVSGRTYDRARLTAWRESFASHLATYGRPPLNPREHDLYRRILDDKARLDVQLDRLLALTEAQRFDEARNLLFNQIDAPIERVDDALEKLVLLNNEEALSSGVAIRRIRRRATLISMVLDGASAVMAAVLLAFTVRAAHISQALRDERRRLAEMRAEELDRFSSVVAHDLKSPLASILISCELAAADPAMRDRSLPKIARSARSMAHMIDALLDFARAESGVRPGVTKVAPVVREVVEQLACSTREAASELSVEPFPSELQVACSGGVLASVLGNLLQNALKYTRRDGDDERTMVVMRVRERDDARLRIEVEDNGPGIPPGMEQTIFESYVRGKNAATTPGLGLGLATVKRLVESHAGQVGVEPSPAGGSLFWVELPRPPARATA